MIKYRFLSDVAIADICFEAYAPNLKMLFKHAALAVEEIMVDTKTLGTKVNQQIKLEADSLEDLLIKYLEELIFLKDSKQLLFSKFIIHVVNKKPFRLFGQLIGEEIDQVKHKLKCDVKAVTRHLFELQKLSKGWKARIVVDV